MALKNETQHKAQNRNHSSTPGGVSRNRFQFLEVQRDQHGDREDVHDVELESLGVASVEFDRVYELVGPRQQAFERERTVLERRRARRERARRDGPRRSLDACRVRARGSRIDRALARSTNDARQTDRGTYHEGDVQVALVWPEGPAQLSQGRVAVAPAPSPALSEVRAGRLVAGRDPDQATESLAVDVELEAPELVGLDLGEDAVARAAGVVAAHLERGSRDGCARAVDDAPRHAQHVAELDDHLPNAVAVRDEGRARVRVAQQHAARVDALGDETHARGEHLEGQAPGGPDLRRRAACFVGLGVAARHALAPELPRRRAQAHHHSRNRSSLRVAHEDLDQPGALGDDRQGRPRVLVATLRLGRLEHVPAVVRDAEPIGP